jgi:hypothetical protein
MPIDIRSPTMSYEKHSISMWIMAFLHTLKKREGQRRGGRWCTYVGVGGVLFLDRHVTWACSLSVRRDTPARDMLDVWPALPLIVRCDDSSTGSGGQRHCVARAQRSCLSSPPLQQVREFEVGNVSGGDATAIPGADTSEASGRMIDRGLSFPIRSWVGPPHVLRSPPVGWPAISGFTETTFVCHSPQLSAP